MTRCTGRCDGSCNGTRPLFGDCRAVGIENAGPEEAARPFGAGPPLRLTLDFETGFELWVSVKFRLGLSLGTWQGCCSQPSPCEGSSGPFDPMIL